MTRQADGILLLDAFLAGDDVATEQFRTKVYRWFAARRQIPLERALGLPATKVRLNQAVRNAYLVLAANEITDQPGRKTRAALVADEIERFLGWQWPAWQYLKEAPPHAAPIDRILFQAQRAAALPTSPHHLAKILGE